MLVSRNSLLFPETYMSDIKTVIVLGLQGQEAPAAHLLLIVNFPVSCIQNFIIKKRQGFHELGEDLEYRSSP